MFHALMPGGDVGFTLFQVDLLALLAFGQVMCRWSSEVDSKCR